MKFSEEYDFGLNHEVCAVQLIKDLLNVTPEEMSRVVLACKYNLPCVVRVLQLICQYPLKAANPIIPVLLPSNLSAFLPYFIIFGFLFFLRLFLFFTFHSCLLFFAILSSFALFLSLPISLFSSLFLFYSLTLTHSLSLSLSPPFLSPCLCLSFSLYLSLPLFLSLSLSLYLSLLLSLSLFFSLSLSFSLSLTQMSLCGRSEPDLFAPQMSHRRYARVFDHPIFSYLSCKATNKQICRGNSSILKLLLFYFSSFFMIIYFYLICLRFMPSSAP